MESTRAPAEVRSTGRVVGPLRAMLLRMEGHWVWYRRHWHSTLARSGVEPLLFLGAMGRAFGSQVEPSAATGGHEYLHHVAPALLVVGAVMSAIGESSFRVLSGFKWQQDFVAVTATPVTPGELLGGQLLWVASRLLVTSAVYAGVALLLGAWLNAGVVLVVVAGVLTGMACSAPMMALAAVTRDEGMRFVMIFRLG
jgi:lipooligosaccharide transport system permease protein